MGSNSSNRKMIQGSDIGIDFILGAFLSNGYQEAIGELWIPLPQSYTT
jgi:hypothetical protein